MSVFYPCPPNGKYSNDTPWLVCMFNTNTCCLIKEFTPCCQRMAQLCLSFTRLHYIHIQGCSRWVCIFFFFFQVHKMIAEFKLIPGLNNLFDKLIWRKHSASALVLHGHNQNCDCSPVSNFILLYNSEKLYWVTGCLYNKWIQVW